MAIINDQRSGWSDVELPCVVRYRRNAFIGPLLICGFLFLAALTCTYWSGQWFAGVPFVVLAVATMMLTLEPLRHVRSIDCVLIDRQSLTLHYLDGSELRIAFVPGGEFLVRHGYFHRSIVYATAANDYRDARQVMVDVLDLPRGQDIYGLCRLLNDLGSGDAHRAGASERVMPHTVDWYREPPRLSRTVFAGGCVGLILLLASLLVALDILSAPLDPFLGKLVLAAIKLGLGLLFVYPAYRFLVVGRLRDLGEAATHRNVNALIWHADDGPLRLFAGPGTPGRNPFGPEPMF